MLKDSLKAWLPYLVVLERTSKNRTSNSSNFGGSNFERLEHVPEILRPNFEHARPNIELLEGYHNSKFLTKCGFIITTVEVHAQSTIFSS